MISRSRWNAASASSRWRRKSSPLGADLHGLPPVLIQAGTDELLHGQALALHDALQAASVTVRCEITPQRWHVIHVDAYAHQVYVPAHLASREFFAACRERLLPGGGQIVVLPQGLRTTLHLPGNIYAVSASLIENYDTPEVAAGYILAEAERAVGEAEQGEDRDQQSGGEEIGPRPGEPAQGQH